MFEQYLIVKYFNKNIGIIYIVTISAIFDLLPKNYLIIL